LFRILYYFAVIPYEIIRNKEADITGNCDNHIVLRLHDYSMSRPWYLMIYEMNVASYCDNHHILLRPQHSYKLISYVSIKNTQYIFYP